jgi:cytochrome c oxidase assembly protein subunit 15
MKAYRKFALLTVAATYFLIFVGGLVRVSGAGMGCPDWPRCFGRWFPPTSIAQLPADIDPATFNVTLAWIEYINRLVGMTVGFLILGVAILALKHFRREPRVLYPSLLAALLVAVQGWQGSQVVSSELAPFIVTIHMVLALIIVSLLIYAALESYVAGAARTGAVEFPRYGKMLVSVLWVAAIVQIILGSQVRQALEHLTAAYPHWSGAELFPKVGAINDLHLIFGLLVAALTLFTGLAVLRSEGGRDLSVRRIVWTLIGLVTLQAVSGLLLLASGLPALTDLFHLWMAALFVGLLLVLLVRVGNGRGLETSGQTGFGKTLALISITVVVMMATAYFVVRQAEESRNEGKSGRLDTEKLPEVEVSRPGITL